MPLITYSNHHYELVAALHSGPLKLLLVENMNIGKLSCSTMDFSLRLLNINIFLTDIWILQGHKSQSGLIWHSLSTGIKKSRIWSSELVYVCWCVWRSIIGNSSWRPEKICLPIINDDTVKVAVPPGGAQLQHIQPDFSHHWSHLPTAGCIKLYSCLRWSTPAGCLCCDFSPQEILLIHPLFLPPCAKWESDVLKGKEGPPPILLCWGGVTASVWCARIDRKFNIPPNFHHRSAAEAL